MTTTSEEDQVRLSRARLRQATFIDPRTSTRSKRRITLHNLAGAEENTSPQEEDDRTPLLADEDRLSAKQNKNRWISRLHLESVTATLLAVWTFITSDTGKGVFKCALAYLLGSMATFLPPLSNLFGRQDSKHLIATITVYFHPARSLGSMLDALLLAFASFLYTSVVSVISMSISVLFADVLHLISVGHAIILIFFVGGGLGFVGWIKLKKGDPLVNIACSLTSLSLITVLTKEGAVQDGNYSFYKIAQILKMLVAGVMATMLISFTVFPTSARLKLKQTMVDTTDALSDMLGIITSSFISGDEKELSDQAFTHMSERQKKGLAGIAQQLKESKYENYFLGTEKVASFESKLANCLQRIAQSVGGLRAAAAMQFVIVNQPTPPSALQTPRQLASYASMISTARSTFSPDPERKYSGLTSLVNSVVGTTESSKIFSEHGTRSPTKSLLWRTPPQIFELFIDHLGPSMRSLAYTMKEILDDLPFDPADNYRISSNPRFIESLDQAVKLYKEARTEALKMVYDKKDLDRSRPFEVEADWEEAAACCGHFSFSLLEVAETIKDFVLSLDELQIEVEEKPSGRTWSWLKIWKRFNSRTADDVASVDTRITEDNSHFLVPELKGRDHDQVPERAHPRTWKERLFRRLYNGFSILRREDNKFAIKVGFGAMLYALPSYISATRPLYSHWRGEWGLLSYMLVCSITIGTSNTTGYQRFLGTGLGAVLALISWQISNGSPFALAFFGFCMAYWTAYIIIGKGKGPMGRFIMLTYNLSALYAYSLTAADDENDGDEEDKSRNPMIFTIASHRVVAVLSGCIWGLIITRAVWPISARQKLKDGLSLLWLRMGLIWQRDPLSVFTEGEHPSRYMNLREELELQRFVIKLQGLVEASKHEFEFRGHFPHEAYTRILKSASRMLEAFHEMNLVILKDLTASPGEMALLRATEEERRRLCSRISHLFSVLASSMKLEYCIATDSLPSTHTTRDRLLARIFGYRKSDIMSQQTTDEDYGLLYTYALFTGQIGMEIQNTQKEIEELFGVLDEEALWLQ